MNGENTLGRLRFWVCIMLLQASLVFLLSSCAKTSCNLQAVAGGSAFCEETSK
jgi:hypothetical protein